MSRESQWTIFTNHGHVMICLTLDPEQSLREVALRVGITERAVQRIVADLEDEGFLERERKGRHNRYRMHPEKHLRHPLESHCRIGDVLEAILRSVE